MGLDQRLVITNRKTVANFRKENHLRRWLINKGIVEEDDDCIYRNIEKEQLEALISDIKTVLKDHTKAKEILPLCDGGFFFGAYNDDADAYSEWYFTDLQRELEQLTDILNKVNWDNEYLEYFDWW